MTTDQLCLFTAINPGLEHAFCLYSSGHLFRNAELTAISLDTGSRHHTCVYSGPPSAQCRGVCAFPIHILWVAMNQWAWDVVGWSRALAPNIGYLYIGSKKSYLCAGSPRSLKETTIWGNQLSLNNTNDFWDLVKKNLYMHYVYDQLLYLWTLTSSISV